MILLFNCWFSSLMAAISDSVCVSFSESLLILSWFESIFECASWASSATKFTLPPRSISKLLIFVQSSVNINLAQSGASLGRSGIVVHYCDAIMGTIASQITSLTIVYTTVYSDADQSKHQSSASLAFVWGIHRDRWIPRTKGQLRGKCFHLMTSSCSWASFMVVHLGARPRLHFARPTFSVFIGRHTWELRYYSSYEM